MLFVHLKIIYSQNKCFTNRCGLLTCFDAQTGVQQGAPDCILICNTMQHGDITRSATRRKEGMDDMTVTGIAKQLGGSSMTIYRRLEKNGVAIADLRNEDGELTAAGASLIASYFDGATGVTCATDAAQQDATGEAQRDTTDVTGGADARTMADTVTLRVQVAAQAAQIDGLNALVEQLREQLRAEQAQREELSSALRREQDDRQHERLMLAGTTTEKRHWWQRVFKSGEK